MYCSDTDKHEAIRLPHLRIVGATKLNEAIEQAKRLVSGNAYVLVKLAGGSIASAQPLIPLKQSEE